MCIFIYINVLVRRVLAHQMFVLQNDLHWIRTSHYLYYYDLHWIRASHYLCYYDWQWIRASHYLYYDCFKDVEMML